jgi:very-short-patch-repair endonuclease
MTDFIKDIENKLPKLLRESAELAADRLPLDQLAKCESPIEKLFLCGLWSRGCWTGALEFSHAPHFDGLCMDARGKTVAVCAPQVQVGPYRLDFLLALYFSANEPLGLVAVECDGHEFHERTKEQAARDKSRDRDLQMRGIQVFRYTGSEIWREAGKCADEVLGHLQSEWADKLYRNHERRIKQYGSLDAYLDAVNAGSVRE